MRIKNLFSKIGKTFMSILFASGSAGMVSAFTTTPASAASFSMTLPHGLVMNPSYKWSVGLNRPTSGYYVDSYAKMYINGKKVYCINQGVAAVNGTTNYSGQSLSQYFKGNPKNKETLELISAFGYGFNGDTSDEMDFATQLKIWEITDPGAINTSTIDPSIKTKMNQIQKRIDDYNKTKDLSFEAVTETTQNRCGRIRHYWYRRRECNYFA